MRIIASGRMNKFSILLCLAALFVLLSSNAAFARGGWYITPKLGFNVMEAEDGKINNTVYTNTDADGSVLAFGVAGGFDFSAKSNLNLRLEGEAMFRTSISNDYLEYNAHTFMFNAFYDFRNSTKFTPYVGAGIGLSIISVSFDKVRIPYDGSYYYVDDSGSGASFAMHVGAGCYIELSELVGLDFGYRYMYLGNSNVELDFQGRSTETWEADLSGHEFTLGFRFNF